MLKKNIKKLLKKFITLGKEEKITYIKSLIIDHDLIARYAARIIGTSGIFVEIGSATGASSIEFSKKYKIDPHKCYLVEACPENFKVMSEKAIGFNIFNYAITSKSGYIPFYVVDDPNEAGTSRSNTIDYESLKEKFPNRKISTVNVKSLNLSDFFSENNIAMVDYLFMNVEGAEYNIFSGNIDFLKKVKLFYMDLHGKSSIYNAKKNEKLRIYDLLLEYGFEKIGGHTRENILNTDAHLSFFWENALLK
jgi:FkbM family methyltransferase